MISARNLLVVACGALYLGIGYAATISSHPPMAAVLVGLAPFGAAAVAASWKAKARWPLLLLCAACMVAIAMNLSYLRNHIAWLYFIQHVGAMIFLGITFGSTLGRGHHAALCSRIASFIIPEPLDAAYFHYTWKVTFAWTIYFAASAAISILLFFLAPIEAWSFFANVLTPVFLGAMFVVEYLVRQRLMPGAPSISIIATIQAYRGFDHRQDTPPQR
ncbi:MAG: hypothetical protein OEV35_03375 [Gallionellaceae bacterium]|nr:hypothetical protein [Gallionellaceae bacterium]